MTDEQIIDVLPHGSGIDGSWTIRRQKNGKVRCYCSYHGMDENGYYDGWQDFYVVLADHAYDVHLCGYRVHRGWAYGLLDYLSEVVGCALEEASYERA